MATSGNMLLRKRGLATGGPERHRGCGLAMRRRTSGGTASRGSGLDISVDLVISTRTYKSKETVSSPQSSGCGLASNKRTSGCLATGGPSLAAGGEQIVLRKRMKGAAGQ